MQDATQVRNIHHRLVKNPRKFDAATLHGQGGFSRGLGHLKIDRGTSHSGRANARSRLCRQRQLLDPPGGRKALGFGWFTLPAELQFFNQSLGRQALQLLAQGKVQRQPVSNFCQRRQIQTVRRQSAVGKGLGLGIEQANLHIAARPMHTIPGVKGQGVHGNLNATLQTTSTQATGQTLQIQRLQVRRDLDRDGLKRQIGSDPCDLGPRHIDPGAQGAGTLRQVHAQIDIVAQLGQIDLCRLTKNLSGPTAPIAFGARKKGLLKLAHDRQAGAPARRRVGIEAHGVLQVFVANHQIHIGQRQRGHATLVIGPSQLTVAHHQFRLGKNPLRRSTRLR